MKKQIHSRFVCIILMVSMFALGIYCEDIRTNSFFSYAQSDVSGDANSDAGTSASSGTITASLQPVRSVSDTDGYCEKNALNTLEQFIAVQQASRNLSISRLSQLFVLALFLVAACQFSLSFRNSFLHTDAYANRYHQRTLEYIHHNDGKKA